MHGNPAAGSTKKIWRHLLIWIFLLLSGQYGFPSESAILKGSVFDREGNAAEGAQVFVYDSRDIRRPADFISQRVGKDGAFSLHLPPGTYLAIARLKKGGGYGPLMAGDRHSGEPVEVVLSSGMTKEISFTIADIMDAGRSIRRVKEGTVRISGTIVGKDGIPAASAYAVAHRERQSAGIPDYLSAWTDKDGAFTLYLPGGRYAVGAAGVFPLPADFRLERMEVLDADRDGLILLLGTKEGG